MIRTTFFIYIRVQQKSSSFSKIQTKYWITLLTGLWCVVVDSDVVIGKINTINTINLRKLNLYRSEINGWAIISSESTKKALQMQVRKIEWIEHGTLALKLYLIELVYLLNRVAFNMKCLRHGFIRKETALKPTNYFIIWLETTWCINRGQMCVVLCGLTSSKSGLRHVMNVFF